MWLKIFTSAQFIKKFSQFFAIGLAIYILVINIYFAGITSFKKGPTNVSAQDFGDVSGGQDGGEIMPDQQPDPVSTDDFSAPSEGQDAGEIDNSQPDPQPADPPSQQDFSPPEGGQDAGELPDTGANNASSQDFSSPSGGQDAGQIFPDNAVSINPQDFSPPSGGQDAGQVFPTQTDDFGPPTQGEDAGQLFPAPTDFSPPSGGQDAGQIFPDQSQPEEPPAQQSSFVESPQVVSQTFSQPQSIQQPQAQSRPAVTSYDAQECNRDNHHMELRRFFSDGRSPQTVQDLGLDTGCGAPIAQAQGQVPVQSSAVRVTSYDAPECVNSQKVIKRFFSDNRTPEIVQNLGNSTDCGAPIAQNIQAGSTPVQTSSSGNSNSSTSSTSNSNSTSFSTSPNIVPQNTTLLNNPTSQPSLSVSCQMNPSNPVKGQATTFTGVPFGNNLSNDFSYSWTGNAGPNGGVVNNPVTGNPISVTFNSAGRKNVEVRIHDNSNRVLDDFAMCSVIIPESQTPILTQTQNGGVNTSPVTTIATTAQACPSGSTPTGQIQNGQIVCQTNQPTISSAQITSLPTTSSPSTPNTVTSTTLNPIVVSPAVSLAPSPTSAAAISAPLSDQQKVYVLSQEPTSIQDLPKTGLPLAGLALGGLFPIGTILRKRLGLGVKEEVLAQDIWNERLISLK